MRSQAGRYFTVLLILAGYFTALLALYNFYSADIAFRSSKDRVSHNDISGGLSAIDEAIAKNGREAVYYRERARIYLMATAGREEVTVASLKRLALHDLEKAYDINPNNLSTLRNSIPLYYFLATKDLTLPADAENVDRDHVEYSRNYYMEMKNVSPNDVSIFVDLAKYEDRLGMEEELEKSISRIRVLRPDLLDWHGSLQDIQDIGQR